MKDIFVFRHVPREHLGSLADALRRHHLSYRYIDCAAGDLDRIHLAEAAGLIVMGGPMNVDETSRYPWLTLEDRLIREALEAQLPVLGICLGGQLMAKALGAPVTRNPQREIGWYPLRLHEAACHDPLLGHFAAEEIVFQWHGDTFAIPDGAVPLASSPLCANQAFRYGPWAYGLQFHVEVTAAMIAEWLAAPEACSELGELGGETHVQRVLAQTLQHIDRLLYLAEGLGARFSEMVRNASLC